MVKQRNIFAPDQVDILQDENDQPQQADDNEFQNFMDEAEIGDSYEDLHAVKITRTK